MGIDWQALAFRQDHPPVSMGQWFRVSRNRRCSICGKPDWCTYQSGSGASCCMRVASERELENGGWLHKGEPSEVSMAPRTQPVRILRDLGDWSSKFVQYGEIQLARAADDIGVPIGALRELGCGWSRTYNANTFPMRDGQGKIIGYRLRERHGKLKRSAGGDRAGLFIPRGFKPEGTLYICEGPTDTAAMLGVGFNCIGRPACLGQESMVVEILKRWDSCPDIVIVSDRDEADKRGVKAGIRGANRLAERVHEHARTIKIVMPDGAKDAREWIQRGATRVDIVRWVGSQPYWRSTQ